MCNLKVGQVWVSFAGVTRTITEVTDWDVAYFKTFDGDVGPIVRTSINEFNFFALDWGWQVLRPKVIDLSVLEDL